MSETMWDNDLVCRWAASAYGDSEDHAEELRILDTRVRRLMLDCAWRTASEIRTALNLGPETDVLRRLRASRPEWIVEKRVRHGRTWEYRLSVPV